MRVPRRSSSSNSPKDSKLAAEAPTASSSVDAGLKRN